MNNSDVGAAASLRAAAGARLTETVVAGIARIPLSEMRGATRGGRPVATARQLAMYLAHVAFGLSLTRVGTCFGRDRTTVRHACALMEDRRDDLGFECGLNALEAALLALMIGLQHRAGEARR